MNPAPTVKCKLIGICGHAGAGKDTVADYIRHKYDNTWKLPFARPLKTAAAALFGIPEEAFHDSELKELPDPYWTVSPRQIAQFFGTEMVRETIGKLLPGIGHNFWIARLEHTLTGQGESPLYDEDDVVTVPDVRFQNEYDWIISQGGIIIHLTRPGADGTVGISGHASESGLSFTAPSQTHALYNTGSLEELYAQVDTIIAQANIYPFSNPELY